MANIGVLLGISPQHLILRAQEWDESKGIPNIGETVYLAEKKPVGVIADIFGPVSKPFISIQLHQRDPKYLESFKEKRGISFYTLPGNKLGKSGKPANRISNSSYNKYPRKKQSTSNPPKYGIQNSNTPENRRLSKPR